MLYKSNMWLNHNFVAMVAISNFKSLPFWKEQIKGIGCGSFYYGHTLYIYSSWCKFKIRLMLKSFMFLTLKLLIIIRYE
jgi:hypothetical protein